MKRLIYILLMGLLSFTAAAQYNNEWIDYSKAYYKFKVGATGLYRISQAVLSGAGLGNVDARQFQLWRNGKQVAVYTSVVSGLLPVGGYIEFWGEKNDGKPDGALYKNPANQLSTALSLETDTAAYFLTINMAANSPRITDATNNVAGNVLPPEPYFMYDYRLDFQQNINYGHAEYYGEYVYSSTYDVGEFWATNDIYPGTPYEVTASNLYVATNGPSAYFKLGVAGNSYLGRINVPASVRHVMAYINGTKVIDSALYPMDAGIFNSKAIAPSTINAASPVKFSIQNTNTWNEKNDRIAASFISLSYPRLFNFGGASNFPFNLPANAQGYYLEITNFNAGNGTPVLYDLTTGQRYTANNATAGILKFVLPAYNLERNLVLVSEDASNINNIAGFTQRNFVNFADANNQGDYLIIAGQVFMAGENAAGQYASYRGSAAGGSYRTKTYDADELVDQFAFGIKKHPLSIKNFLKYARAKFSIKPKFCLLMGKAVTYNEYRLNESSKFADQLNLVPTFGWPASDNLLASDDLYPLPATPIGRIAAIRPAEVLDYLSKIRTYEQQQNDTSAAAQTIDNKAWMKTMVHIVGANSDPGLDQTLTADENRYKAIISAPLYGANVSSFNTTSVTNAFAAEQQLRKLFANGISIVNYFGHSASTTLDYNLSNPNQYPNPGKYPLFIVNGCNAGNIYSFDTSRLTKITSLSELFVLTKDVGAIGFLASTHFGVDTYLDVFNDAFYRNLASPAGYNHPVTTNINAGIQSLLGYANYSDSISYLLHGEENVLHGDPAIKINAQPGVDFAVEEPQVIVTPTFISVANLNFNVKANFYNLGKVAGGDSVSILITRQYPDGSTTTLVSKRIPIVKYIDSVSITVPIAPLRDKGENKITVTIDNDGKYKELSEANNTVTKSIFIFEDELTPVYPYNFAIVNKSSIKLVASTANAIMPARQYAMELDTTELFNSAGKISKTVTSIGGEIEFDPATTLHDSTVYYWRVAPVPAQGDYHWNNSSFVYLPNSSAGFNQSHVYQHLKSSTDRITFDSTTRTWDFDKITSLLNITNAVFDDVPNSPQSEESSFAIAINNRRITSGACVGHSIIFNVFDPETLKPLYNQSVPSTTGTGAYGGFMGSGGTCSVGTEHAGTFYNFEFVYNTVDGRNKMAAFMEWVPAGYIVTARVIINKPYEDPQTYAPAWKNDPLVNGTNFYLSLKNAGFTGLDQYTSAQAWIFAYRKSTQTFTSSYNFTPGLVGVIDTTLMIKSADSLGYITSPAFGPAKAWKQVKWNGTSVDEKAGDKPVVSVIGVTASGAQNVLYNLNESQQNFDISSVSASTYPYIILRMRNADSITLTPYQLRYWRILYDAVPEGALAPNILYRFNDTLGIGQTSNVAVAFKNVSDVAFADSIAVKMIVYNANNVANVLPVGKLKPLQPGDTATIAYSIDSKNLTGINNFYLDVNPDNAQPEQYHFNNFFYRNILVQSDDLKPTLDVTFDGVHILNNDIVSAKPHVMIKLKDESKFLLLDDTSVVSVQLMYPDGTMKRFAFNTDTVRFTPATTGSNGNVAQVDFLPFLTDDGTYTLYIHGKDKTGNPAGNADYTVSFMVYNKPMITNMFNYPNPFTTSTAFVFTLTGSQLPQNMRIQILTITGKIVREITMAELGPLHVGRNITDYKWDGTDQFGQKLANGVYLYRVITNLNGHSLDKFSTYDTNGNQVNTDQYFNKGYGKMYLMR